MQILWIPSRNFAFNCKELKSFASEHKLSQGNATYLKYNFSYHLNFVPITISLPNVFPTFIPINVPISIPSLYFLIGLYLCQSARERALIGHLRGCGWVQRMCWLFGDYVSAGHCASLCCGRNRKASVCWIWRAKVGHTLPLPASFPVCPGRAGGFWPAITQKDKTLSTKPQNITTTLQKNNSIETSKQH